MNKVDCVEEFGEEQYEAGFHDAIKKFIANGFSLETVSKGLGLSVAEIKNILKEVK